MIDDLPPEVAAARALLRQAAPLRGSKRRVYQNIVASSAPRRRIGARTALVGFCLAASTSAMALGYRFAANRASAPPGETVSVLPSSRAPQVTRRPKNGGPDVEQRGIDESAAPMLSAKLAPPPDGSVGRALNPAVVSPTGVQRAALAPQQERATPHTAPVAGSSELSQQVRDYREAVAPMRSDPQLALARLQAYRSKWPQSAIGEEVDLRVIEALLVLNRRQDAAAAASRFVRRYPGSARAAEIGRLAGESARPGVFDD